MQKRAYLLIIASGVLWGTIGIFVRGLYGLGFSSLQVVTLRVFFSSCYNADLPSFYEAGVAEIQISRFSLFCGDGYPQPCFL